MLGYSADELASLSFAEFTHPDDVPSVLEGFQGLLAGRIDHWQEEKRYLTKDGRVIWGRVTVSAIPALNDHEILGLPVVFGIVRGHKGMLKVTSEPGRGTTFTILIPAQAQDTGAQAPGSAQGTASSQQKVGAVLLVDDEASLRTVAERLLSRLGYSVFTAVDGCEALTVYREHHEDIGLVLLDLTMPRMDGEETFRELRRLNPEVRVIISSGYAEEQVTSRFGGQSLVSFLQKPYRLDDLRERIQAALEAKPIPAQPSND